MEKDARRALKKRMIKVMDKEVIKEPEELRRHSGAIRAFISPLIV